MANKLFLVCATLALCFLLINASSYRTIVEFDEDDATNPSGPSRQQKCRKEFQQEQHLQACQRYMAMIVRIIQVPPLHDDEFEIPRHPKLTKCCNELRQEDTDCVCPTLRKAAIEFEREGVLRPYETSAIYRTAKLLPEFCNIQQVGTCPFRSPDY